MNQITNESVYCPEVEEMFFCGSSCHKFSKVIDLPAKCKILNIYVNRHDTKTIIFSYLLEAKSKITPVTIEFALPGMKVSEDSEFIGTVDVSENPHFRTFFHCFIVKKL